MSAVAHTSGRERFEGVAGISRDELVDAAFLVALTILGLVGFKTTYGDLGYLVPAVGALLIGIVIAHLAGRLGLPAVAAAAVSVVAFFALGGLALRSTAVAGVIPTGDTLHDLSDAAVHGWVELLTLLPPVGSSGPLLVIPYLLGMAAGVSGYLLARRTRSAAWPLVAPVAVLGASILFGTLEPASLLLQGAAFAALALGWTAVRQDRRRVETLGGTRRGRRVVTSAIVLLLAGVLALAVGKHLPFAGSHERVVMRTYVEPPLDTRGYPSPLAAFRRYVRRSGGLANKTLLTTEGLPRSVRLRFATMDVYDGVVWGVSGDGFGSGSGAFRRVGSKIPQAATGKAVTVDVDVKGYSGVWLPSVGDTRSISFDGAQASALASGYRYSLTSAAAIDLSKLQAGDSYRLRAAVMPPPSAAALLSATAAPAAPGAIQNPPPAIAERAAAWSRGHEGSAYGALRAIADHLVAGSYSDGSTGSSGGTVPAGHGLKRLQDFLAGTQLVGNDEQYAAAFALMASALGYPARVVLGARPEADGTVRGRDVHAWVEVGLAGAGWVAFDVTPPKNRRPHPVPPQLLTINRTPSRLPPPVSTKPPPIQSSADTKGTSRAKKKEKTSAPLSGVFDAVVGVAKVVVPPLGLIVLALSAILAAKAVRRSRRRTRGTASERIAAGWRELVDVVVDLGAGRPASDTRRVVARRLGVVELAPAAAAADAATFGPDDPSEATAKDFWARVDATRRALLADVTRRRRVAAALSLASLNGPRLRRARAAPESDSGAPA